MKQAVVISILLFTAACASQQTGATQSVAQPGHGAIAISIVPNPILARGVGGNMYEFPFEVVVRETGGHAVTVSRVSADVFALGGAIRVANESYDAARIASLGYPTTLAANGELHYAFRPRKEVTDDRLFGGVTADLRVDAIDDTGTPTSATTTVGVTR